MNHIFCLNYYLAIEIQLFWVEHLLKSELVSFIAVPDRWSLAKLIQFEILVVLIVIFMSMKGMIRYQLIWMFPKVADEKFTSTALVMHNVFFSYHEERSRCPR